ncbi:MAG: hypothetical protein C1943_18040 [Halochromatium sp.]|nr:hypothetical protein [Halochromatium sp.]
MANSMCNDPILEEIRQLRASYAEEHGHDMDAIFQDILRRQKQSSKKFVRLSPRSPEINLNAPKDALYDKTGSTDC